MTDSVSLSEFGRTIELLHRGHRVGDDVIEGTPRRWLAALEQMTAGYEVHVPDLFRQFEDPCDEMIVVDGIPFVSVCEHHLMPFTGTAAVGYVPHSTRVVGLSKLARVVDAFAMRFQIQERMVRQIADAIERHLLPEGVGVIVRATHTCMTCRGVRKPGATMVTSDLRGLMREPAVRSEFLSLATTTTTTP